MLYCLSQLQRLNSKTTALVLHARHKTKECATKSMQESKFSLCTDIVLLPFPLTRASLSDLPFPPFLSDHNHNPLPASSFHFPFVFYPQSFSLCFLPPIYHRFITREFLPPIYPSRSVMEVSDLISRTEKCSC